MASFLGRPFQKLARALNIQGGQGSISNVDLNNLAPTLDMNRFGRDESERLVYFETIDIHIGVGSIFTMLDPWNPTATEPLHNSLVVDDDTVLEVIQIGGDTSDQTDFNLAAVAIEGQPFMLGQANVIVAPTTLPPFLAFISDASQSVDGATFSLIPTFGTDQVGSMQPLFLRRGQFFHFRTITDTAGTATIRLGVLCRRVDGFW